ncbi:MAG TPA: DNA polymerase III subunit [Planctomycetota bacterium]|nr:DNA polymerase III subunit [Planctomycetota bacterium]
MRCELPEGHAETLDGLFRAARERRLAHALLFTGPEGIGKFLGAEWLAFGLLCAAGPARPCGVCGPCKRLKVGTHADVLAIDPDLEGEEEIKIGRITYREKDPRTNIGDFLSLKPMEGGWRVVLVRDAERMTDEAQNALLKTLEEPGEETLLALVTARPENLLPTTRSRCVVVALGPLALESTARVLVAQGLAPEPARELARWSRGAPGGALALRDRGAIAMRAIIRGVLLGELDPLAAAAAIGELEGEFPGRTPSARARARARAFLDLVLAVLADVARAEAGADPATLAHGDLAREEQGRSGDARGARRLELCLVARQDVEANLAPDAILERALLALEPERDRAPRRGAGIQPIRAR